jgi:hypothetical protein
MNNKRKMKKKNIKKIIYHDQFGFIPGEQEWINRCKWTNLIEHINRTKDKSDVIISINTDKVFDKIQYPVMIKALKKLGIEGSYFDTLNFIYDNKSIPNIILNEGKLNPFS